MHFRKEMSDRALSDAQVDLFVREGFVKLENAFSKETAAEAREILWREVGCDPEDRKTWTRPVLRLGDMAQEPFRQAANTEVLHAAFDELVGKGRWAPRETLGGFSIRFPHPEDPGDTGWHVDASFPPSEEESPPSSYFDWRINLKSRGRALLLLFLFSDIGEKDAPTRIRLGSHLRVASLLALQEKTAFRFSIWGGQPTTRLPGCQRRSRREQPGQCFCATHFSCTLRSRTTAQRRVFLHNRRFIHAYLLNSLGKMETTRRLNMRFVLG